MRAGWALVVRTALLRSCSKSHLPELQALLELLTGRGGQFVVNLGRARPGALEEMRAPAFAERRDPVGDDLSRL